MSCEFGDPPMTIAETARNDFGPTAGFYDLLGHVYSAGAINTCKERQIDQIYPGERVLYAGVGGGYDAALAAGKGARVTAIDLSGKMLARAQSRFAALGPGIDVESIQGNILDHDRRGHYDVVAANFFLNVFDEPAMLVVLKHLVGLLRMGGRLLIADFRPLGGGPAQRAAQWIYHGIAITSFSLVAHNAVHPIYDYKDYFHRYGIQEESCTDMRICGFGPAWYRLLSGIRRS
jgi:demethylmenaquinone methyltransferase/2-methoxy-6-polyprenyl-1,4-benzoquinol methylase